MSGERHCSKLHILQNLCCIFSTAPAEFCSEAPVNAGCRSVIGTMWILVKYTRPLGKCFYVFLHIYYIKQRALYMLIVPSIHAHLWIFCFSLFIVLIRIIRIIILIILIICFIRSFKICVRFLWVNLMCLHTWKVFLCQFQPLHESILIYFLQNQNAAFIGMLFIYYVISYLGHGLSPIRLSSFTLLIALSRHGDHIFGS